MDALPCKAYLLSGGMVDVVVLSQQRQDGGWYISVLQQMPDWGFRLAEEEVAQSEDIMSKILEGFQRWAGGEIQEVELRAQRRGQARRQAGVDSGWIKLKDHSFFRFLEVR
jgi:hypothetical protein